MEKQIIGTGIVVYKNVIPKEWEIPKRLEKSLTMPGSPFKWMRANVGNYEEQLDHRNCFDFKYKRENLDFAEDAYKEDLQKIHDQVYGVLRACLDDYGAMFGVSVQYVEAFNMVRYGPGEKFNVHGDDGDYYRCTVSAVGYPNDDYEGGELYFNHFNIKVKPEAGDFILCPSAFIYSHAALPVTFGTKYSIVIMTDRNEFAHRNDSPIYHPVEERSKYGIS